MHKGVLLDNLAVLGVEDLGVSGKDNVVDDVSAVVHLGLDLLVALRLFLLQLLALLSVFLEPILLANLVKPFTHSLAVLLLEALKLL